jgi:hypothetical protein
MGIPFSWHGILAVAHSIDGWETGNNACRGMKIHVKKHADLAIVATKLG